MKRWNLFAASLIAATFVFLAQFSLTRENLRFDMKMATGRPFLSDDTAANSSELSVRIANAMQLRGRDKWLPLQQIVADFSDDPVAHATLVRIACQSGGSVEVGHSAERNEIEGISTASDTRNTDPNDSVIMLRSCAAGERLDPTNAYFPAMAAIAHLSANENAAARAALHRAASKSEWREYFDIEAKGRIRRQELLYGPQNSLTEMAAMADMLFPHYAGLRGMARVITDQAMHAEQAGDIKTGLSIRQDVAQLGATIQKQSSSAIGSLVGIGIVHIAELRPGGQPPLNIPGDEKPSTTQLKNERFLAYLESHGSKTEVACWRHILGSAAKTKALITEGMPLSVFGQSTVFETQAKLLVNLFLLGAAALLCALAGTSYLHLWLGQRLGSVASRIVVTSVLLFLAWSTWKTIDNFRAFDNEFQVPLSIEPSAIRPLLLESAIGLLAILTPLTYLIVVAIPKSPLYQRWALPLAVLLTLGYAAHLIAFSLNEQVIRAELRQVITHEGRYIAAKIGTTWLMD